MKRNRLKAVLSACLSLCIVLSVNGCFFRTRIDLDTYSREIDWSSEDLPLVGSRITVSLEDAVNRFGFCFAFHPELEKLIFFYLCDSPSEDVMNEGVILVMRVKYDSIKQLMNSKKWSGILEEVYPCDSLSFMYPKYSFGQMGGGSFESVAPECYKSYCYGVYYPDPENPENYVADVYYTEDGDKVGMFLVVDRGIPWGFQRVYDNFRIEGLWREE